MTESRAHIRDRMLKAASAAWGYTDKIAASDFDPLLALLMDVYAAELERMSNEIGMSRERVLQKMVQLMAPDVLTAPVPAQAILHAESLEGSLLLESREQFFLSPKASSDEDSWFSPAGDYFITDAAVKYLATGGRLVNYPSPAVKETGALLSSSLPSNVLWLGLTGKSIGGAQFYFEVDNAAFYHYLPQAKWWCGDQQLDAAPGFNSPATGENELSSWLQAPHHISRTTTSLAEEFYRSRFIHLVDAPQGSGVFPEKSIPFREQITWIKIVFPENINVAMLPDLHCQVNCFPVINRRLHELTYRLRDWINIIPLPCGQGQQFFDLHKVIDQDGTPFPSVLLRKGGAGRFDERDARAVTEHLLQLLRDESAAFAMYNREFIAGEIKQVQQAILRLSRQMEESAVAADPVPYLEIMGSETAAHRHVVVEYWTTDGATANLIRNGTPLMAYRNGGLRQGGIYLMTRTQGGRDRLLPHESIPAYKTAVLSKDRILSPEDIRLFCIRETGAKARSVEVKKGVMIAQGRHAGYVKTIDVSISLEEHEYDTMKENKTLDHWQQLLQHRLSQRSMAFMPFRVFFNATSN
ncbi:hypothetical protein Q4E93_01825 [Flavitalea sp. BT771]|uniref:hypothetical protein n=1 Tax=Flavitalea sp. BT771 TaxID=3063329 RepID=UPI0026E290BB|nr:hypothetical protein [Flavitalea sp. BT771]MDO6429307.1 hypothetical protein [Flavitalea sp. BT771]MDV6218565.1 hypothetical protein [Flavitalea sp. BT771]